MSSDSSCDEGDEARPVVLDIGSGFSKVGYAGNDEPTEVFRTIVGRPRGQMFLGQDAYIGHEAISKMNVLRMSFPLRFGNVSDWHEMQMVRPILGNKFCLLLSFFSPHNFTPMLSMTKMIASSIHTHGSVIVIV